MHRVGYFDVGVKQVYSETVYNHTKGVVLVEECGKVLCMSRLVRRFHLEQAVSDLVLQVMPVYSV